ncbi:MAG: alpha/beta fold hydrolase [Archangium sp.]
MRNVACVVMLMSSIAVAADPESRARDVVADLSARAFERVVKKFDAQMAGALPPDKLSGVWDGVIAQAGAFKTIRELKLEKKDTYDVAVMRVQFEKADLIMTLAMNAQGQVAGMFFKPAGPLVQWSPPPYAPKPDAMTETEVTVGSKFKLPGNLVVPAGTGPFPAVIFVHGSGPNDRDESTGPNKLFKDLALGLASKGIASLRYDKRTLVAPGEFKPSSSYTVKEESLDDVHEALSLLATNPKINAKKIFVVGHSLGGTLAPRLAADDGRVAGIISLAGATRPMDVLVREQIENHLSGKRGGGGERRGVLEAVQRPEVVARGDRRLPRREDSRRVLHRSANQ